VVDCPTLLGVGASDDGQDGASGVEDPEDGLIDLDGDDLRAWVMPTVTRWLRTWMPPREDTFRCTRTGSAGGAGEWSGDHEEAVPPKDLADVVGGGRLRHS
jgi:hypothetical protein